MNNTEWECPICGRVMTLRMPTCEIVSATGTDRTLPPVAPTQIWPLGSGTYTGDPLPEQQPKVTC